MLSLMAPAQANQSIASGFEVLQEVISAGHALGSREVARRLGMEHSRANRILGTLASVGMLLQDRDSRYLAGPRIHVLSALSLNASRLIPAALPHLRPFHSEGATVALGTLWRDTVVYLLHANPGQDLAASAGAHDSYPRDRSIIGSLLADDGPSAIWQDRPQEDSRAWAARIGSHGAMAIAVVLPRANPLCRPPRAMLSRVEAAARAISASIGP
ncbi:MAG: hypothetical protein EA403_01735 [Spirochaetaceae bacterium]|nr:MAG: hypothetical protein EA403_01735 [Spirochaetaceae bacterium]